MQKRVEEFQQLTRANWNETLEGSLCNARLAQCGNGLWMHKESGLTIQIDDKQPGVHVWAPGISDADLVTWVDLELNANPDRESFGTHLMKYMENLSMMAGQEADAEEDKMGSNMSPSNYIHLMAKLPSIEELSVAIDAHRTLTIYTFGDKLKSKEVVKRLGSQFEINAKPLNGRGGGADTKLNALEDERIMRNVASSMSDGVGWLMLQRTLQKIESEGLLCISIFCSKGRHRSVSMAELMRHYYMNAHVVHLTIR